MRTFWNWKCTRKTYGNFQKSKLPSHFCNFLVPDRFALNTDEHNRWMPAFTCQWHPFGVQKRGKQETEVYDKNIFHKHYTVSEAKIKMIKKKKSMELPISNYSSCQISMEGCIRINLTVLESLHRENKWQKWQIYY